MVGRTVYATLGQSSLDAGRANTWYSPFWAFHQGPRMPLTRSRQDPKTRHGSPSPCK